MDQKGMLAISEDELIAMRSYYTAAERGEISDDVSDPMFSIISRLSLESHIHEESGEPSTRFADNPIVPPEYESAFRTLRCMYWLTRIDAMDIIPIGCGTRKSIEDALRIALELFCLHGVTWKEEARNA